MNAPSATMHVKPVSHALCEFVSKSRWPDIPTTVRHEAKRSLLNYLAVAMAGAHDPTLNILVDTLTPFSAGSHCTLIGRAEQTDMLNACAINAMSANVYDFDDTHERTVIHPTGPVAAPLSAFAEQHSMSGTAFLHALLLGMEVECRVGNAVSPWHYARGWHITSTCGVIGSAMAIGQVLGLSSAQLRHAMGAASNQACGLVETLGTMAKSTSVGNAARNGLLSALLASRGFTGPDHPLEGPRGFLHVMGEQPDLTCLTDGLGEHWEIQHNSYKPYPCGVVLNPVIEACLALSQKLGPAEHWARDVQRIELRGHPLLRQRTDRPGVTSGRASQVCAQHAVAVSLLRGRAGLPEFSDAAVQDPQVRTLGECLYFVDDERYAIDSAQVTLHWRNRDPQSLCIEHARGSVQHPLRDEEIETKFRTLSTPCLSPARAERIIQTVWNLERLEHVSELMQLTRLDPTS
jgi:2-methylcitrate dehydratase PrpD